MGQYRKDGSPVRRAKCAKHHSIDYGLNGWDYKQHRKDYCENTDSRLGFACTSTIVDPEWQLDADHIDGDPQQQHSRKYSNIVQVLSRYQNTR